MSDTLLRHITHNFAELLGLESDGVPSSREHLVVLGGLGLVAAVISLPAMLAGVALMAAIYFGGQSLVRRMSN